MQRRNEKKKNGRGKRWKKNHKSAEVGLYLGFKNELEKQKFGSTIQPSLLSASCL